MFGNKQGLPIANMWMSHTVDKTLTYPGWQNNDANIRWGCQLFDSSGKLANLANMLTLILGLQTRQYDDKEMKL